MNLIKGENIIIRTNRSNWMLINQISTLLLIVLYFIFLRFYVNLNMDQAFIIAIPFVCIWTLFFIKEILIDRNQIFLITNKRLISKKEEIPLSKINDVFIEKTVIGKIFKYGHVIISAEKCYYYRNLSKPDILTQMLKKELKSHGRREEK